MNLYYKQYKSITNVILKVIFYYYNCKLRLFILYVQINKDYVKINCLYSAYYTAIN